MQEEKVWKIEARKIVKNQTEAEKIVEELRVKGFDVKAWEVVFEFDIYSGI